MARSNQKRSKNWKGNNSRSNQGKTGTRYCERKPERTEYDKKTWSEGQNDVSWYTRNSQLALDAGRFSFNWPLGLKFNFGSTDNIPSVTLPGVIAFDCANTIGISTHANSAVNIAARNIYSWVRHANSGHTNYDPADLMMYLLAADSVYSYYAWITRIYGTFKLFSTLNRYYPRALIQAMGVDYDDILANMADFRYYINQFAVKASSLCVPNVMTYYTRHIWLYSNYFADGPLAKSRLYLYNPHILYKFDEANARLQAFWTNDNRHPVYRTFANLVSIGNDLLDRLIGSEDIGVMSGDILKAYGESNLIRLNPIADTYVVTPIYSEEILEQVRNTVVLPGSAEGGEAWNITQDVTEGSPTLGCILQDPSIPTSVDMSPDYPLPVYVDPHWMDGNRLVSASDAQPDPARVLTSTRLTYTTTAGEDLVKLNSCGSEVVTGARIYFYKDDGSIGYQNFSYAINMQYTNVSEITDPAYTVTGILANLGTFHHHPTVILRSSSTSTAVAENYRSVFQTVDNYAIMNEHDLEKLHQVCLLSQFAVPYFGEGT